MKTQEVLDNLALAQAQVEWEYSMDIAAALDVAMKSVKDWERLKEATAKSKIAIGTDTKVDFNYRTGYVSAMSYIEGCMAEMENEDA